MKAVKLSGIKKMELMEVPSPQIINDTDVLIKMTVVGVCGSDVHYYKTGKIGSQVVEYPFAVGHEGSGVVVEVGKAVKKVVPGDRIAVEPAVSCGECQQCKVGRPHTCINNRFLGCPGQLEGNLLEYIVMDEKQCLRLEDDLSFDDGALSEPLSIGLYANKQAGYSENQDIAILGYGPIGMSVLLTAPSEKVNSIYVTDKIEERLIIARKSGVEWAGNPDNEDVVGEISKRSPDLLDIVFECCGEQDAMDTALDIVKPGGKIMMIGIPINYMFSTA
jgi:L-iditol 2-dehydrogenase